MIEWAHIHTNKLIHVRCVSSPIRFFTKKYAQKYFEMRKDTQTHNKRNDDDKFDDDERCGKRWGAYSIQQSSNNRPHRISKCITSNKYLKPKQSKWIFERTHNPSTYHFTTTTAATDATTLSILATTVLLLLIFLPFTWNADGNNDGAGLLKKLKIAKRCLSSTLLPHQHTQPRGREREKRNFSTSLKII